MIFMNTCYKNIFFSQERKTDIGEEVNGIQLNNTF